jgi:Domain of unknown function (DUF4384)
MPATFFRLLCCLALCACAATAARAQVQEEQQPPLEDGMQARGAFLTTREKKPPADTPPPGRRPAGQQTTGTGHPAGREQTAKATPTPTPKKNVKGTDDGGNVNTLAGFSPAAIGIGYTLFMRDANGDPSRIDPTRVFHRDDAIRISLEANTDGYLYVFYTENDGEPQMIFPDSRLQLGNNFVRAHVPYEVPSNMEADERLRWFVFDATPATERLFLVVAREPLPDVPTGETLVKYCKDPGHSCPWNPPRSLWSQLVKEQGREQVAVSRIKDEGRRQTQGEREATTRGLGLAPDAPEPTVVRMNASSTTGLLVTSLALVHK